MWALWTVLLAVLAANAAVAAFAWVAWRRHKRRDAVRDAALRTALNPAGAPATGIPVLPRRDADLEALLDSLQEGARS